MSTAQLPAKMHAIGINQTGDFEVIEKIELPVPANAPGNVLVKACPPSVYAIGRADVVACLRRSIMEASTSSIRTIGEYTAPTRRI